MKNNIEQRRISITSKRGWCPARGGVLKSVTGEGLGVLLQSMLEKAFRGEL